ncbi:uncharacterized protein LOC134541977 [Bacillus rossius redtenbacheri]|uniref:uncharacterized protein LOC134541977 n=1 Tax=Bacillus rossius redtenbacheri TaxID=93214 RepID=UPI002FDE15EA
MMKAVAMKWCVFLLLVPSVMMSVSEDRRGNISWLVRINETKYFGDVLDLALKDISQADVIFNFGGPEFRVNISGGNDSVTLSNCRVTELQDVSLKSTSYYVYHLYGWDYSGFDSYFSIPSSKLLFDYSIESASGAALSSGEATLRLSREVSEVLFQVDNNSTGQYHVVDATGMFSTLGELTGVELTGTTDAQVKAAVRDIFKNNDLVIQTIPTTALNYYILKYIRIIDVNDYIIRK